MPEELILVDENDQEIGYQEKESCHYGDPCLHRAFSILIFNDKKQMLIQKRSNNKKTWPGSWANACCSSPQKGEDVLESAKIRLEHELGFSCDLIPLFKFRYKAFYDAKWGEYEIDHVLEGYYNGLVNPNKEEVAEFKFIDIEELKRDAEQNPRKYAPWFLIILKKLYGIETHIADTEWHIME
jgi:isopentenyl-diphosphate delta-isomerase